MAEFFEWLSGSTVATAVLVMTFASFVATVILIYLIAFFQGRPLSFWPPTIGARPSSGQRSTGRPEPRARKKGFVRKVAVGLVCSLFVIAGIFLFWCSFKATDLQITHPTEGARVSVTETVLGTFQNVPEGEEIWVLVYSNLDRMYFPHSEPATLDASNRWLVEGLAIGALGDAENSFTIIAGLANQATRADFEKYLADPERHGLRELPPALKVYDRITVIRK